MDCQRTVVFSGTSTALETAKTARTPLECHQSTCRSVVFVTTVRWGATVWFAAQTKCEWADRYTRDPTLAQQFAVQVLPALSMVNIRALLRAAMPLPQPTPEEAVTLVAEHFVNRTRSRKSRLKRQKVIPTAHAPP